MFHARLPAADYYFSVAVDTNKFRSQHNNMYFSRARHNIIIIIPVHRYKLQRLRFDVAVKLC